jgi:hypothetical protein
VDVPISLAASHAPAASIGTVPENASRSSAPNALRTAGWVTLAAGALAGVTAGVLWGVTAAQYGHVRETCNGMTCPSDPSALAAIDAGRAYQFGANVSTAVAAVGLAAGAVLIVVSGGAPRSPRGPSLGFTGAGVALGGVF